MPKDGGSTAPGPMDGAHPEDFASCPDELTLASYLDAKLSGEDKARMDAHLARCGKCARAVAELRDILAQVGGDEMDSEEARSVAERAKKLVGD